MAQTETRDRRDADTRRDTPCYREVLQDALSGILVMDRPLERMLDHLERTR